MVKTDDYAKDQPQVAAEAAKDDLRVRAILETALRELGQLPKPRKVAALKTLISLLSGTCEAIECYEDQP